MFCIWHSILIDYIFFFTGHEVYLKGTSCFKTLVDQFGDRIVGDDGEVDRKVLGSIVFSNPVGIFIWKEEEGLNGIQIKGFYSATFCVPVSSTIKIQLTVLV